MGHSMRTQAAILAVVIMAVFMPGCSPQGGATLRVVNYYSDAMVTLNVSPSGSSSWGPNKLRVPLPSGSSRDFSGFANGSYDLRAIAANGSTVTHFGAYLDESNPQQWTLTVADKGADGEISAQIEAVTVASSGGWFSTLFARP